MKCNYYNFLLHITHKLNVTGQVSMCMYAPICLFILGTVVLILVKFKNTTSLIYKII